MVGEGVGEMVGAIVPTSTSTIPGRDIPATEVIILSSIMAVVAAAFTPVVVSTAEVAEVMAVVGAIAEIFLSSVK
jgi:hypothetical protein